MAIKYIFHPEISQEKQKNWIDWHTINVERDVYPSSIRMVSKNSWLVSYKTDGMTNKKLEKYLWMKGYFKPKGKYHNLLKHVRLIE